MERRVCSTDYDNQWDNMIWIPILNIVFSMLSLAFIIKYFFDITHQFNKLKNQYQSRKQAVQTTKEGAAELDARSTSFRYYSELKR